MDKRFLVRLQLRERALLRKQFLPVLPATDILRLRAGYNLDAGDNILRSYESDPNLSSPVLCGSRNRLLLPNRPKLSTL